MFDIEKHVKELPTNPGVYLMRDKNDEVIYVGKAKVLKNRVSQYFHKSANHSPKVKSMVKNITSFEYIITDNELEALILECNLIKKYKPKYNILLRDDKTYPYIKVTLNDDYPRIIKVRRIINDKAKYFGPFTNITAVNETIDIINSLYPIRTCNYDIARCIKTNMRPCLEYYINNCVGPCNGKVTKESYMSYINDVIKFLSGNCEGIINLLKDKMKKASDEFKFEEAALYRDKIQSINNTLTVQKITKANSSNNKDVIAVATDKCTACICVFFIRDGKVIGRENFILEYIYEEQISEIIYQFISQYYSVQKYVPHQILVETDIDDKGAVESYLSDIAEHKVSIHYPKRGENANLVELVKKNAFEYLNKFAKSNKNSIEYNNELLSEIKNLLELDDIPNRIESYDISHIQGVDSVGAMVVYTNGKKDPKEYRRYKIKSDDKNNDTNSLVEILSRRLKYGNYPDLILVDGGRNQVNAMEKVLKDTGLNIEVWGMYKDKSHRTDGLINSYAEIILKRTDKIYKFIASIQEEVHRYAIAYHKSLRIKHMDESELDNIKGIGKVKKQLLYKEFKTIDNIKKADVEELMRVKGITEKLAKIIYSQLH